MREAAARLKAWLFDVALPLWWERGADLVGGGYVDRLNLDGSVGAGERRLRVQARQAYVYALAAALGWRGPAEAASRHGLAGVLSQKRDDGLFGDGPG
ncbi:MAG: AGE family epimerase/isomerase, partial [Caulobacteraceae bacterium]